MLTKGSVVETLDECHWAQSGHRDGTMCRYQKGHLELSVSNHEYRCEICPRRLTDESNVIFDIFGAQAWVIWQPPKGGNAGEDGVGLYLVSLLANGRAQSGMNMCVPVCRHLLADCCTTETCEVRISVTSGHGRYVPKQQRPGREQEEMCAS